MTIHPHRLRLHGGRNTHAARPVPTISGLITACGYLAGPRDQRLPDDTPVTCRTCTRRA